MDFGLIFLTGLTVGGLTCLAVQGGLLASTVAARKDEKNIDSFNFKSSSLPVILFLVAKLIVYVMLGFLLGLLGQAVALSDNIRLIMQAVAGFYMIAIALNLLNVHPIFRYVIIQTPSSLRKLIRNQSKKGDFLAPIFLGAMTIFLPCGTTLAMEALAISSSKPLIGAAIMGAFILGTTPLFFSLGYLTAVLKNSFNNLFLKVAGIIVLYLGIVSVNGSLVASGSTLTLQKLWEVIPIEINLSEDQANSGQVSLAKVVNGVQTVDINIDSDGYSPSYIQVKKDQPVKINLIAGNVYNCALSFRIPSLGISKDLQPNTSNTVDFTPTNTGKLTFSCSMGMYPGTIEVI